MLAKISTLLRDSTGLLSRKKKVDSLININLHTAGLASTTSQQLLLASQKKEEAKKEPKIENYEDVTMDLNYCSPLLLIRAICSFFLLPPHTHEWVTLA